MQTLVIHFTPLFDRLGNLDPEQRCYLQTDNLSVRLENSDWNSGLLVHAFSTKHHQSFKINILILAYLNFSWYHSIDIQIHMFIILKDLFNIKMVYLQIDPLNTVYMLCVFSVGWQSRFDSSDSRTRPNYWTVAVDTSRGDYTSRSRTAADASRNAKRYRPAVPLHPTGNNSHGNQQHHHHCFHYSSR